MCPCPHTLNMIFTAMLTDAVYSVEEKSHSGIYIEAYATGVGYRQWSRPTKLQCVTSCSQMTVRLTLPPKPISNWASRQRLTYLVTTLSRSPQMDDEVNSRIAKSNLVFGRLSDRVWQKRGSCKNSRCTRQQSSLHYCMPLKHAHHTSATSKRLTHLTITA